MRRAGRGDGGLGAPLPAPAERRTGGPVHPGPPVLARLRKAVARLRKAVDPYVLALAGTVALAALLPATGGGAEAAGFASNIAIGLLFFLYGVKLSTREAVAGLRNVRLHLLVVLATFVLFPLLGLAAVALAPGLLTGQLQTGLLFLCVVPSTVQSSVALTSAARGDVAAAICAGTYSSLLGLAAAPLLAAWLIGPGAGLSADGFLRIGGQLLLPFLAGQLLRSRLGGFVARHRRVFAPVDRGSILLVVYVAFSAGVNQGVWGQVTPPRLLALLIVLGALLTVALTCTHAASRLFGLGREERIATVLCGSQKSLANGLPMAAVVFGAQTGLVVLPLMLYHQLQLMVCAALAGRWARSEDRTPVAGRTSPAAAGG